jgi:hypothetical protein
MVRLDWTFTIRIPSATFEGEGKIEIALPKDEAMGHSSEFSAKIRNTARMAMPIAPAIPTVWDFLESRIQNDQKSCLAEF